MLTGRASTACSMRPMCQGPGVQVVASVPCAGPVPPPSMVVMPECSASSTCCGQMKWMCVSKPPAVRIRPSPAMTSVPGPMTMVTPGWVSGLPALPMACDAAVAQADVGLVDAGPVDDQRVGDDGVDGALGARRLGLAHAVADHLAAAELHLLAVGGEVAFDLDDRGRCRRGGPGRRWSGRTCRRRRRGRSGGHGRPFRAGGEVAGDGRCPHVQAYPRSSGTVRKTHLTGGRAGPPVRLAGLYEDVGREAMRIGLRADRHAPSAARRRAGARQARRSTMRPGR